MSIRETKKLIFGLGTGRCGTLSLHALLGKQPHVTVGSETAKDQRMIGGMLAWGPTNMAVLDRFLGRILSFGGETVGDVAWYLLPYVEAIIERYSDAKFVCLQREKTDTIVSWLAQTADGRNHWTRPDSKHWDKNTGFDLNDPMYPKYDLPKAEAIGAYWDAYYGRAFWLKMAYPENFRVFDMDHSLNTKEGQVEILSHAGIDPDEMILHVGLRLNRRKTSAQPGDKGKG